MNINQLKNKKILIVGYGVEGQETEIFLKKHVPSATITIVDKKDGKDYLKNQKDFDLAIKSPSVLSSELLIPFTTATNIFLENAKGKTIGITGTKGKSTTTALIYEMLKKEGFDAHLGGNIGIPPLSFIDSLSEESTSVLELSSFQLADITKSPHIAVMLMTAPEHLDHHADITSYIEAKRNILKFQTSSDYAILNADYPATRESDLYTEADIYWASTEGEVDQGCFIKNNEIYLTMADNTEKIMDTKNILLKGKHNLENVCSAIMASLLGGASMKSILPILKTFKGLPYRLEFVGIKNGVQYYNDSLATIPQATIGALEALGDDVETLIAGGFDRGIEYSELGTYIAETKIKTLILFPETGGKIWEAVEKETPASTRPQQFMVTSMTEAVKIATEHTTDGKICLMSPASSSFNLFKDYKDRGDQFREAVNML